jgi:hypothetical protein
MIAVVEIITHPTPDANGWGIDDAVIGLRREGTELVYRLPDASDRLIVGAAADCDLRLEDPTGCVSRQHARLVRSGTLWTIDDLGSRNGIRQDGELRLSFQLTPGVVIDVGGVRLVAESERLAELRRFLARIIGWTSERADDVDRALRAVRDGATRRASLLLLGAGELSSIARRLHSLALGRERPFELATESMLPSLDNVGTGTVCISTNALPSDVVRACRALHQPTCQARVILCAPSRNDAAEPMTLLERTAMIELPALATRRAEIDRLLLAWADDAKQTLGIPDAGFREHELHWLREVPLASHFELEELALRVVALRSLGVSAGAKRLGITHAALSRWARRRNIPT